jgi:hypothetical protein
MPRLVLVKSPAGTAGEVYPLPPGATRIGRDPEPCPGDAGVIVLPHHALARRHAYLTRIGDVVTFAHCNPRQDPLINGRKVCEPVALNDGDRIKIGDFLFEFRTGPTPPPAPDVSDTRQYIVEVATTEGPISERYDTYAEAAARVEALPAAIVRGVPFIFHELPDGSQRLVRNDLKPLQWHRLEHEQDVPLGDDAIPLGDENDIPEAQGHVGPRIKPITRPVEDEGDEDEEALPLAE